MTKEQLIKKQEFQKIEKENTAHREKYWRKKLIQESLEFDDDNVDLENPFKSKKNVPEDLVCLWEQQIKIMKTKSLEGYRWDPKSFVALIYEGQIQRDGCKALYNFKN